MPKFRKKPIVIEAVQWDGHITTLERFKEGGPALVEQELCSTDLEIPTLEGVMTVKVGDWIIRGVNGEFYPCKPDIFAMTYEPVEESES